MVDVCLLGCGGMMPLPDRRLTALLYRVNGKMVLIDCGEGTQVGIKMAGWGFKGIDMVCFTHYHADHVAGLPGFLSTLGNSGKADPLILMGPPGLTEVVKGLTVILPEPPFEIHLIELPADRGVCLPFGGIEIKSLPLDHHTPCLAYCLEIRRAGRFDPKRAEELGIPVKYWKRLQRGEQIEREGRRYEPDMVTGPARRGIKVSYCTDTRPVPGLSDFCENCDLLVCEGMYGEEEKRPDAVEKKHMLFSEAASLAKKSGAGELWLTHFSPSMKEPGAFWENARCIFAHTEIGRDIMKKTFFYEEPPE